MTDAERQRRHRAKFRDAHPVTKPKASEKAQQPEMPRTDGALRREISRLRDELTKAKMQLLMAQTDLRRQAQAGAPNVLVLALQSEIKSLKGQLAHEKAQAKPPSEREIKLRETIRKLGSRLRNVANRPPRGTLIMSKRDKNKFRNCLHPDKRYAVTEKDLTEAMQIFNGLNIREP